jgi:hypothetical protein
MLRLANACRLNGMTAAGRRRGLAERARRAPGSAALRALADLDWADLVFIWGASELDHRVSNLYTHGAGAQRRKVVQMARRGIAALLNAGADHVERQR